MKQDKTTHTEGNVCTVCGSHVRYMKQGSCVDCRTAQCRNRYNETIPEKAVNRVLDLYMNELHSVPQISRKLRRSPYRIKECLIQQRVYKHD